MTSLNAISPHLSFFQRLKGAFSQPLEATKTGFWVVLMALETNNLHSSLTHHCTLQKTDEIWQSRKQLFLDSASWISFAGFGLGWMHQNHIIPLGQILGPIVGYITYSTTALTSSVYLWNALKGFYQNIIEYSHAETENYKKTILERQLYNLIKIISHVALLAWSVLSLAAPLIKIGLIGAYIDLLLSISVICFVAEIALYHLPVIVQKWHHQRSP